MSPCESLKERIRLDNLLVRRGLVPSRQKAQALIMAGLVKVEGKTITKAGHKLGEDAEIEIVDTACPYVSRGGLKLEAALDHFKIEVMDKITMDVGASTGGFTDCLLQRGAKLVYAIDVGYGQLDWKLRRDPRVRLFERTNIRYFSPEAIPDRIDLVTIDVSFISLKLVLPVVKGFLGVPGDILALVKPQFEVGRGEVGKGGIVRDLGQHQRVIQEIISTAKGLDLRERGVYASPLKGADGNQEYFLHLSTE